MNKRIRGLLIGLALLGLFGMGIKSFAEEPLYLKFTLLKPGDYETYAGGLFKCNNEYAGGNAEYFRRVLFAGDCHERKCNNVACCIEERPPG